MKHTHLLQAQKNLISRKLAQIGLASIVALPQLAMGTEVAPYFESWAYWGGSSPSSLMQAKAKGGLTAATIAFGISGGGCTLGGGMENIMSGTGKTDVQQFITGGGRLILSFGGAAGNYLEGSCSENDMFNLVKNIIDTSKVYALDFDIEGSQLGVSSLNDMRNKVIKRLQAAYPNLYVSFTLPVDPTGLPASALTLLRGANAAGVKVSVVNVMAMDYGAYYSNGKKMGDLAISAANATFNQIKAIFTGRSDAQLWAMIGVTPMIGVNDVSTEIFKQTDAQQLADFAKLKGMGLLSFWALQRDQPGTASLDSNSMINTRPYEFYQILDSARTGTTTPTPPTTTTPPSDGVAVGRYTIVSSHSNKCLDVTSASTADGANLQQYACNGTAAQQFDVSYTGNNVYRILNVGSGKAVDVASASTADGANVQQWTSNDSGAQRFSIKVATDVTQFTVKNQTSGKCLDVADWSTADGGNIQQWTCGTGLNQKFKFVKAGTTTPVTPTPTPTPLPTGTGLSDPAKKEIAMQLVSSAENSTLNWKAQYQYIQDIGDGRGYTAGIIGFCSGTGDMLELVSAYTSTKPGNILSKYLPALKKIGNSASHTGLDPNFVADWKTAAADTVFQQSQNAERDRVYFGPSVAQAKTDGLRTLGQFIYYDAIVMHGPGNGGTSFGGIRSAAIRKALPPSQGGDEAAYLNAFLDARVAAMKTEEAHSDVTRVETEQRVFLRAGNFDLNLPLSWKVYGDSYNLK